jgi:hypothetical protein
MHVGAHFRERGGCICFSMNTIGHGGIGRQRCIARHFVKKRGLSSWSVHEEGKRKIDCLFR